MKVTKKNIRIFVKEKLATDKAWATKALVRIFQENQTADEQNTETVIHDNGIGFSGADGEFLSSLAKQQIQRGSLSPKQMEYVHKRMPKYWNQVVSMSDEAKLNSMVDKHQHATQNEMKF
jgi:hypothetical protein